MSINLDLSTIQSLISPTGGNDPLVQAIFTRQYNRVLVLLHQLHQRLQTESPQVLQDSGFSRAITVLGTFPTAVQKKVLHYPTFSFWLDVAIDLVRRRSNLFFPEMHIRQHLQELWRFVLVAALHAGYGELTCTI